MPRYQIKISKSTDLGEVARENWKDLISSLVLAGYEIYADEDFIVFESGSDDVVTLIEE